MFGIFKRKPVVKKYIVYMQHQGLGARPGPIRRVGIYDTEEDAIREVNDTRDSMYESWYEERSIKGGTI